MLLCNDIQIAVVPVVNARGHRVPNTDSSTREHIPEERPSMASLSSVNTFSLSSHKNILCGYLIRNHDTNHVAEYCNVVGELPSTLPFRVQRVSLSDIFANVTITKTNGVILITASDDDVSLYGDQALVTELLRFVISGSPMKQTYLLHLPKSVPYLLLRNQQQVYQILAQNSYVDVAIAETSAMVYSFSIYFGLLSSFRLIYLGLMNC